jgi:DNA-binding response OmpR family regulator
MIDSILLVDDENLFAEDYFANLVKENKSKPDCIFVDLNIIGSSFDGIELVRRINFEHGDGVVIGIISSSDDEQEQAKALKAGAQFWIIKSDEIEPRLEDFTKDFDGYKSRTAPFKVYK